MNHKIDKYQKLALIGDERQNPVMIPVISGLNERGVSFSYHDLSSKEFSLTDIIRKADIIYCPGKLPITNGHLDEARNLRALISIYTGTEGFDESAATSRNILVANGQASENSDSVAEATVLMMLAALYDLAGAERMLRADEAEPPRREPLMLRDKTIGLIGFGQIARAVVTRLQNWNVRFLISTPRPRPPFPDDARFVSLDELLPEADILCILAPLTPETANLMNYNRLAKIKRGCVLINMSRGGLVDEHALYQLAKEGHFGAIALDVFGIEPLPKSSPLRKLPNAILTPHALGHTREAMQGLDDAGLNNIMCVLEGRAPPHVRNPEILPDWLAKWSQSPSE